MRKFLSLLLVSAMLALSLTGCGSAWWSNMKKDPITQVNSVIQTTQIILAMSDVVFQQVKVNLPADKQIVAQQKYDAAVIAVTKSLVSIRDFLQTAADAKQENPDMTKVLADLRSAVENLQAVVNEVRGLVSTPAPMVSPYPEGVAGAAPVAARAITSTEPVGYVELNAQADKLKAQLPAK